MYSCKYQNPLETPKPTSGEVAIDASRFETRNVLFFDRFRIERGKSFFECHFGFYGQTREVRAGLIVVISRQVLKETEQSVLQYLKQLGSMPDSNELPPCNLRPETDVVSADILGLARHGEALAEIIFHAFSWRTIVERVRSGTKKDEPLAAVCVALLRCDIELHKRWILDLYEESEHSENS
jgi:hypothetical protein